MTRLLTIIALLFATPAWAVALNTKCKSSSGMSTYVIAIDSGQGTIRYQFMGQDVLYRVVELREMNGQLFGQADFEFAYSGEKKGAPIYFTYNFSNREFSELNTVAKCSFN